MLPRNRHHGVRVVSFLARFSFRASLASPEIYFPRVRLVACGSNEMHQLGVPDCTDTATPRPVKNMGNVNLRGLASGGGANAAIVDTATGKQVWTWGCGDNGGLGRVAVGDEAQIVPAALAELDGLDIIQVSCGDSRS